MLFASNEEKYSEKYYFKGELFYPNLFCQIKPSGPGIKRN